MFWLIGVAMVAGAGLPVQTTINTRLGRRAGAVFSASLVSFAVGTVVLVVALAATRPALHWAALGASPWWVWVGGLCGVVFLTANILLMRRLGAAAAVVLPVVGQVIGGAVLDSLGAFGTTRVPLTVVRVLATLLVIAGAALVNLPSSRGPRPAPPSDTTDEGAPTRAGVWVLAGLALVTGSLSAAQTAINGVLGVRAGSPLFAATVSFAVGTVALVAVVAVTRSPLPLRRIRAAEPWWIWSGGALGAVFVLINASVAPHLGTGLTVAVVLAGQLVGGLAVDHFGVLGAPRRDVTWARILGLVLVLAGVAIVRLG